MPILIIFDAESHRGSVCTYPDSLFCQNENKLKKKVLFFISLLT